MVSKLRPLHRDAVARQHHHVVLAVVRRPSRSWSSSTGADWSSTWSQRQLRAPARGPQGCSRRSPARRRARCRPAWPRSVDRIGLRVEGEAAALAQALRSASSKAGSRIDDVERAGAVGRRAPLGPASGACSASRRGWHSMVAPPRVCSVSVAPAPRRARTSSDLQAGEEAARRQRRSCDALGRGLARGMAAGAARRRSMRGRRAISERNSSSLKRRSTRWRS